MKWLDSSLKQQIKGVNFLIMSNDKILIQKRDFNTKKYPNCYAIPGGGIDTGETPLMAVVREVFEETDLNLSPTDFVHLGNFCYLMDKKLRVNSLYICFVENPNIVSKEGTMIWMTQIEVSSVKLARNTNVLLPKIFKFIKAIL